VSSPGPATGVATVNINVVLIINQIHDKVCDVVGSVSMWNFLSSFSD